jgi:hypothetical protein
MWCGLALATAAFAAPAIVGDLGAETTLAGPWVVRRGATLGVSIEPSVLLSFEVEGAFYPTLGSADWSALTRFLLATGQVRPDLLRVTHRAGLRVAVWPVHNASEEHPIRLGIFAGAGVVRTTRERRAGGSQVEGGLHPSLEVGVQAEAWRGFAGVRVRLDATAFGPVLSADPEHHPAFLGVALVLRTRPREPAGD